jgi:hypothetical protein
MAGFQNDPGVTQQEAGFGFDGRFFTESYSDSLTAATAGTQAAAVQLLSMFNRIATAAAGSSAQLPASRPGVSIAVVNAGANPVQVFAQNGSTDTINGVAGSTGVSQMQNSVVWYSCVTAGTWLAQGLGSGYAGQYITYSTQTGITATASGTISTSIAITAEQAQISTAASGSGVRLPPAVAGMELTLINNGANSVNVFPASAALGGVSGGDAINALSQNTAYVFTTGTPLIFYAFVTGTWITK